MVLVLYSICFISILDHLVARRVSTAMDGRYGKGLWQKVDDMILSPIQTQYLWTPFTIGKNAQIDVTLRWTDGIVPYEFSSDFNENDRNFITNILKKEYKDTCIQFRPRNKDDKNYIRIISDEGCWSYVGKVFAKQEMSLNKRYCLHQRVITHEFLHALGLFHQHSAHDRDKHITINWKNVDPNQKSNFQVHQRDVTSFDLPYDFQSIMHYGKDAFSINGKPTIIPKAPDADQNFGNYDSLSKFDILKIKKMYKC